MVQTGHNDFKHQIPGQRSATLNVLIAIFMHRFMHIEGIDKFVQQSQLRQQSLMIWATCKSFDLFIDLACYNIFA